MTAAELREIVARLTPAEREVCIQLLHGSTSKVIAERTGRAMNTVRVHILAIYRKMEVPGQAESIVKVVGPTALRHARKRVGL